jgi:hypothetical protein
MKNVGYGREHCGAHTALSGSSARFSSQLLEQASQRSSLPTPFCNNRRIRSAKIRADYHRSCLLIPLEESISPIVRSWKGELAPILLLP